MSIYKGKNNAALLRKDRSVVELYKGDTRIFGYNSKVSGEKISVDNVHPVEHKMRVSVRTENLADYSTVEDWVMSPVEDIIITDEYMDVQTTNIWAYNYLTIPLLKANTTYTLWFEVEIYDRNEGTGATKVSCYFESDEKSSIALYNNGEKATRLFTYTPTQDKIDEKLYFNTNEGSAVGAKAKWKILVIEGNHTLDTITPYVDPTAVTVGRYGKNLFKTTNYSKGSILIADGSINTGVAKYIETSDYIPLKAGTYTISYKNGANLRYVCLFNQEKEVTGNFWSGRKNPYTFTINEDCFVRIDIERADNVAIDNYDTFFADFEVQLEPGKSATTYEEYKGETYNPTAEGTVEGITSTYPNMTLLSYTPGVVIECEYVSDE